MNKPHKFILLDRDGTIIFDRNYPHSPDQVELLPNAIAGLHEIVTLGYGLIVISNQSGIGRGIITVEQAESVNNRMRELLAAENITLAAIYHCPHHPDDHCNCRKPATGMIDLAVAEFGLKPSECYVIGDKCADIQLAENVHATGILVRTGYGAETEKAKTCQPAYIADDLLDAAQFLKARM